MVRSLRGRLIILLFLLVAAAGAAGGLMVGLFRQSATAQAGQAEAEIGRACDAIGNAYRFYSSGWHGPPAGVNDDVLRQGLTTVVQTALRDRPGIEGGIWQSDAGSLAYAFPTYQGSGPKTDVPQAELPHIQAVNQAALAAGDRQAVSRYDASSQILLLTACPLPGPIPSLTAWTMTRVVTLAGSGYRLLMMGLSVLFAAVLAAAVLLTRLTMTWSRHVARIETALQAHDIAELPTLPPTGERELDRIVMALNDAGQRLAEARRRADQLARQVETGERLAAIGRVAAGVAHEIRNPIAAMRLKAENAMAGDSERKNLALTMMLGQIERLDALVRRLLSVTERETLNRAPVALKPFLESCLSTHLELARSKAIALDCAADSEEPSFDSDQMRRALDNLVLNAIEAAPAETAIVIAARHDHENLVVSVCDGGSGPPAEIRDHLFEPFVTSRADGTGLGLSIVREVAAAHGGIARLSCSRTGTVFEIVVPWRLS
ncbi:sensor histidine kinase [Beijerinckia indica]|uniref:histidine kinase n=1 Tax=Beijerinckia indica subsp. indica (strain ATCC 9039 / DSM 1715 / NCIMB 8712) TaxID=395963 RepID=B2IL21_BEII9|nr:HAMP domain-containing sensor histidine kinase [Beijerinckia indica]ACB96561.1 integral membrane sensor signal transduction histidine kinase [Beijerinckia indica subsp. indica ATCC 9039]